jgi:hypothetical protein
MDRRIEVDYLSPVVQQHNEAVQDAESSSTFVKVAYELTRYFVTVDSATL